MLNLTKNQLAFLTLVELQDDWHYSAFADVVADYYQNPEYDQKPTQQEFEELMVWLKSLSADEMMSLQQALMIFAELPPLEQQVQSVSVN